MNGNTASAPSANHGGGVKSYIAWLTGILIGIPALINSGMDVYDSVMGIPVGSTEKLNEKKRSEHFQEEPLFFREIEFSERNSKKILKLFVYANADIYVNYSGYQQWLPAGNMDSSATSSYLISSAHAGGLFGTPSAIVEPTKAIGKEINLDTIKAIKFDEGQKYDQTITRSYWFEETSTMHSFFSPSKRTYTQRFNAVDGYRIVSYKVDVASINNAHIISKTLSEDGSSITVQFSVSSGPIFKRWRGWIKAQVITEQEKL